jgi:hypothetical protein
MTITDFEGQLIRLTARQWSHILQSRSFMVGMQSAIQGTLESPEEVRKDRDDPDSVRLYYRRYTNTPAGDKLVCVVVKFLENDAFILTAFPTSRIRRGELIWAKES